MVLVLNLKAAKLAGEASEAMILAASVKARERRSPPGCLPPCTACVAAWPLVGRATYCLPEAEATSRLLAARKR